MDLGKLYFVTDEFYNKFKGCGLLENRDMIDGKLHHRPCCYLFKYDASNIYWMIPISSKLDKYKGEYNRAMEKYNMCDNISFGYVLGEEKAFLPQNLFPVIEKYIGNIYVDSNTQKPIQIERDLMSELNAKARKKIRFNKQGKRLGFTDIVLIEKELLNEL